MVSGSTLQSIAHLLLAGFSNGNSQAQETLFIFPGGSDLIASLK